MAGWGVPNSPWKKKTPVITTPYANANANRNRVLTSTGKNTAGGGPVPSAGGYQYTNMLRQGLANQATKPGGGTTWWTANLTPGQLQDLTLDPNKFKEVSNAFNYMGGAPPPGQMPGSPGSGGGGYGGGGGGGGGGPAGMTQEMFDYLASIMGKSRPQDLAYNPLDLPDPSQTMKWDPTQYGVARQGVASGIEGIRNRGNTAFDQAQGELSRYQNPFEGGLRTNNPDLQNAMQRMMQANGVNPGQVATTNAEGVQADQAMRNSLAMLAGTDQARMAGNMRALQGDRTTFDQNLGLEANNLNLGVNMAEARGKTAFDQRLQDAMMEAANQEAMQNWQRQNAVGDTNVNQQNQWNADILKTYLQLVGGTAPGVTLPAAGTVPW
jgi:Predicted membrane protein